ncbi:MAG: hypothetical protein VKI81_09140 [Synechococcaceae cyanobacterium]|nr:hypothetical protein [Synechococcaceae cyanobacterium]
MPASLSPTGAPSETLVGSLCRELATLRERARQLVADLGRCRDGALFSRLRDELLRLEVRRGELQRTVRGLQRGGVRDRLALAFLVELSRRPLAEVA